MDEALLAVIIVLLLGFLVLRGPNLWYWRINELLDTLHQMDKRLEQLNKKLTKMQNSFENQPNPENSATVASVKEEAPAISKSDIPEM